jgi:ABC-type uncharacterized transport system auxiliary subunit
MRRPIILTLLIIIFVTSGCITVNVPIGGDPESTATVWTVEPDRQQPINNGTEYVVQIKDFSSAQTVGGVQMVVISEDGTVNKAATDIWSSRPIELLPDILMRDMVDTQGWGAVLRKSTMLPEDLIVEGYVREFGGRVTDGRWEAVLDVDVTLLDGNTYDLLFQENYRFHWELESPAYSELARAMNVLVGIWSEEVIGDIWTATLPIR